MTQQSPVIHYLKDYQAPNFDIVSVFLEFELHPTETVVTSRMQIQALSENKDLILAGEELTLLSVLLNGGEVGQQCVVDAESLTLKSTLLPKGVETFELVVKTMISPQENTALEGLYRTSGNYCSQCEAQGFRKITYFFDRPDVLTLYTTKIIADKNENAVLLSNGNLIESGELEGNRHYAVWQDPFKKPSYLFALVAGNLECVEDQFVTAENRTVALKIYVEARNLDKCAHAMDSLKKSMRWDETRFGLSYDLDIYMIVAVDDFNMGAMENKGLNVFNSKFILAKPETATDVDYEGIESVIGHEYFHNWTGNRVTCRDWFQLTLKEGLTVFRDQEFSADMLSSAVKRIEDVKGLRNHQFPEDAGPMAHPIQPQSYIEMNNFYTMTVYEKGAEVVRLYHTLLGEAGFRKGMDLYGARHDGQAVTVVDFRNAMADANDVDLSQMHAWYVQAGTPTLTVKTHYDAGLKTYQIECRQQIVGRSESFEPLLIPLKIGLLSEQGEPMPLIPDATTAKKVMGAGDELVLRLSNSVDAFTFTDVASQPIPSLLRGFSAPVHLEYDYSDTELSLLASADTDSFVRWESFQLLALNTLKENVARYEQGQPFVNSSALTVAFANLLNDSKTDSGLIALTITLPDLTYLGEQLEVIDVEALFEAHLWLRTVLAEQFETELLAVYSRLHQPGNVYRYHKDDIASRKLKNACLRYLMLLPQQFGLGKAQYELQENMTDVLAALETLTHTDHADRIECLEHFYQAWREEGLVLDKWFALQAASSHVDAFEQVQALVQHPDFKLSNPNRARSVLGVFGRLNLLGFHREDGLGYEFLASQIIQLDALNPQVAARIITPFTQWQRYDASRKQKMHAALERMLATPGLSKDLYEIISKSLG